MVRSSTEGLLQEHIGKIESALIEDEDLGLTLKFVLKQDHRVEKPEELITNGWSIQASSLYKEDATRTDRRFNSQYRTQLEGLGKSIEGLAESYRKRQDAGLVLVLRNIYISSNLRNSGFKAITMGYEAPYSHDLWRASDLSSEQMQDLERREIYVDGAVRYILQQVPSLVISPFLGRVGDINLIGQNPLLTPECVIIYSKLGKVTSSEGRISTDFLGIGETQQEIDYLKLQNIKAFSPARQDVMKAVKDSLGIQYSAPK